ncbi:protein of unknown function [Halobacillus dabanensis]|uniref:DUF4871 domain-containing protein n=1 Tax=Halobacillus dabanensis TaxID=240302 RepID=A0A1I3PZP9_HALDA|nr:DUF4871 domain-containing protein [Halobacillus dabanensis]SFJ26832.1 protein of unknown function [Halobacillus dabanensis]
MKKFLIVCSIIFLVACQQQDSREHSDENKTEKFEAGSYTMLGIEEKVGLIYAPFIAGENQKYMWHFWGEEEELEGEFIVKGKHVDSGETVEVFKAQSLTGPHNGADASIPSLMSLPESGEWRLNTSIGGEHFGTITVEVKE